MAIRSTREKKILPGSGSKITNLRVYAIILTIVIVACSFVYLRFAWSRYQRAASSEAIVLAESLSTLLHPEHIAELSGTAKDLHTPEYITIKLSLRRLVEKTNPIRFAYLMAKQDDRILFLADSEAVGSPDYSPPGEIYEDASDVTRSPFYTGKTVLSAAETDRWGTWISALVPVKDPVSKRIVAVFGIDYSAAAWYANLWKRVIPDLIITLCILLLSLALLRIWFLHMKLRERNKKLAFNEALFFRVFDQAPIGIAIIGDKSFVTETEYGSMNINAMYEKILGRSRRELNRVKWTDITHADDLHTDLEQFERFQKGELDGYSMEKRFIRPDGSSVWTNMKISKITGKHGDAAAHLCLLEDISSRKHMEEELREGERSKAVLLSHISGMAYRCRYDREWTMLFVSDGCRVLTGHEPEDIINNRNLSFNDLIAPEYHEPLWDEWRRVLEQRTNFRYEYEIVTKSGERKWVLELAQGIFDREGNVEALEGIVIDISEQKEREAQVIYLSEHDFLTGLYNRGFYEKELGRLDRQEYLPLSIAICDIDGLKMINDAFGHAKGDRLICDIAGLIRSCCRSEDMICRTGGDEFTLILPQTDHARAKEITLQIQHIVESYGRNEKTPLLEVSLSIGYGTKDSSEQSMEDIIRSTEESLTHRKLLTRKSSHNAILSSIMATLYAKSQETEEHGQRMTQLTRMIGEGLGLAQKELDDLELLSMLHDIGKIGVDDRVLNKPGKLTPDEWIQMKMHSEIGHRIAMTTPELEHIAEFILCHHERWDGTGYPSGVKGSDIPLPARILAVADAYDAMTENRVYRNAMSWESAIAEIQRCAGSQFDPEIVHLFVNLIREQMISCPKTRDTEGCKK